MRRALPPATTTTPQVRLRHARRRVSQENRRRVPSVHAEGLAARARVDLHPRRRRRREGAADLQGRSRGALLSVLRDGGGREGVGSDELSREEGRRAGELRQGPDHPIRHRRLAIGPVGRLQVDRDRGARFGEERTRQVPHRRGRRPPPQRPRRDGPLVRCGTLCFPCCGPLVEWRDATNLGGSPFFFFFFFFRGSTKTAARLSSRALDSKERRGVVVGVVALVGA
mmetsp:Transcript_26975/g.107938  ORF Transcript_26975/g.107938 Transcript_26975/m.107938 type:complete len:226 (+) Transcript_26975:467-1144(+)